MTFLKRNVIAVTTGALVLVGGSYAGARALTAPASVTLDAASTSPAPSGAPAASDAGAERGPIRGEAVIARKGQFPTVRFNRGVLQSVDGTTLVIDEADGTTVRVETNDGTKFRRDREKAALSDLKPGDHVGTMAIKEGDAFTTKFVRAFSPDAWSQHQGERQQRRAQRKP